MSFKNSDWRMFVNSDHLNDLRDESEKPVRPVEQAEQWDEDDDDATDADEYDGQPSEYDEWQDVYGGDDWDHGQYDSEDFFDGGVDF